MDDDNHVSDGGPSEIARKYYALFQSELGQEVLEHMRKQTVEKPTMQNITGDGNTVAMLMALREGENNLYRRIKSLIKTGEGLERNG